MADTTTTAYGLTKPEIGASEDTWGTKINTDLDTLDTVVNAIGGKTAAATLSYADAAKIATTATGVDVTGTVTMDGGSTTTYHLVITLYTQIQQVLAILPLVLMHYMQIQEQAIQH